MFINTKCMLLSKDSGKKKDGSDWHRIRFLEKESGENIDCFVDSFGKFEKVNIYGDCDCKFNLKYVYDKNLKAKVWRFYVEV